MTERFKIDPTVTAAATRITGWGRVVMEEDVERIVRAEVERALYARQENPLGFGIAAYLAARFPEAAPKCVICDDTGWVEGHGMRVQCSHNVSADPQRTVAAELNDRLEPQWERCFMPAAQDEPCVMATGKRPMNGGRMHFRRPDLEAGLRVCAEDHGPMAPGSPSPVFSPDRLDRLEAFCTALAKRFATERGDFGAAARAYLQERKG